MDRTPFTQHVANLFILLFLAIVCSFPSLCSRFANFSVKDSTVNILGFASPM